MRRILIPLALLMGGVNMGLAGLALTGLASARQPHPAVAATGTVLLLVLPILGLASLFPRRQTGLLFAGVLWPILLLTGLPLYFPGERLGAVHAGLNLLFEATGARVGDGRGEQVARTVDRLLVEPSSQRPSPDAELARPEVPVAPLRALSEDEVALPYDGRGHTLQVPVTLDAGRSRVLDVNMIFDTGATYTTLDRATLTRLGVSVPSDTPTIRSQTANGEIQTPILVLERLWLGGMEVEGVTVAICDVCATTDGVVGLLGLNVSNRFLVTLDTARQEMILQPRLDSSQRTLDVSPWIKLEAKAMAWSDGRLELEMVGWNQGQRPVKSATVEVGCEPPTKGAKGKWKVNLEDIPALGQATSKVRLPEGDACASFSMNLTSASW